MFVSSSEPGVSRRADYRQSRSPRPWPRREREGAFTATERDRGLKRLNADLAAWILVELTAELTADAQTLLIRHGLRSGDAVQLASCLHLQRESGERISFAAFDDSSRHGRAC